MTGAEFAASGHTLARAYARLRPGAAEWLDAWKADDRAAADELHEWELEGHPFTDLPIQNGAETMTATDAITAMLALYAAPGAWKPAGIAEDAAGRPVAPQSPEARAWSLEGALYRVVGDPEAEGITEAEWRRRETLASAVFAACGVDLMAFNDAARHQGVVVAVLHAARTSALNLVQGGTDDVSSRLGIC